MTKNGAIETFEIERKYEVDDDAALPAAGDFSALGMRLGEIDHHALLASYFDTPEGALAAQRLALRRRSGGKDEGWHLKSKSEDGARELLWPYEDAMPRGLRSELSSRIGEREAARIGPIASLRTDRRTALLFGADGTPLVELADDRVDAVNEITGRRQQWREWEAELMPGVETGLLDAVEPLLLAAGASRVRGTSKIQRTMQEDEAHAED